MTDDLCCSHKTKERSSEEMKNLIHRLNRIEGQIRGIRGMVEKNAYCTDILTQSAAVTAAINAFNRDLLGQPYPHLRGAGYPHRRRQRHRRAGGHFAKINEIGGMPQWYNTM